MMIFMKLIPASSFLRLVWVIETLMSRQMLIVCCFARCHFHLNHVPVLSFSSPLILLALSASVEREFEFLAHFEATFPAPIPVSLFPSTKTFAIFCYRHLMTNPNHFSIDSVSLTAAVYSYHHLAMSSLTSPLKGFVSFVCTDEI
jgi:hypothetical protein